MSTKKITQDTNLIKADIATYDDLGNDIAGTYVKKVNGYSLFADEEREKLKGVEPGATKTTVDTQLSGASINSIANAVVTTELNKKQVFTNLTTSLTSASTNSQYPSAKATYDAIETVREIASGAAVSYSISLDDNPDFNSQNSSIIATKIKTLDGAEHDAKNLKVGDNVYITSISVPDRWVSNVRIKQSTTLPTGYADIPNLKFTGKQRLDMQLVPTSNTAVEICVSLSSLYVGMLFGSYAGSWTSKTFGIYPDPSNTALWYNYNCDTKITGLNIPLNTETIFKLDKNLVYIDNELKATAEEASFICYTNLFVGGGVGISKTKFLNGYITYIKVWEDGELICDAAPAYEMASQKYGVYDKQRNLFISSDTTTECDGELAYEGVFDSLETVKPKVVDVQQGGVSVVNNDGVAILPSITTAIDSYLKAITGYNPSKNQTLKNLSGTFTWVDDGAASYDVPTVTDDDLSITQFMEITQNDDTLEVK